MQTTAKSNDHAPGLRTLRQRAKLSQTRLAEVSKVSRETINRIETRRANGVRLDTLTALADALGVSLSRILAKPTPR